MKNFRLTLLLPLSLALTGCAQFNAPNRLASYNSPANPNAPDAAHPSAAPFLMTGNNYAMSPEADGVQMDMGAHSGHSSEMKMPQHEGHDHKPPANSAEPDDSKHSHPKQ